MFFIRIIIKFSAVVQAIPMIISGQAIILTMQHFSEEQIMSVITAIFQAILQAIAWIFPISETGHSALFHSFADRADSTCSALTGVIHIGIAVGIVLAMYKTFMRLGKEFFGTFKDLAQKNLKGKKNNSRHFMYMTLISFLPMILWLIPIGDSFLFTMLTKTSHNTTLLDDGIFVALTGALLLIAHKQLSLDVNKKNVNVVCAVVIGFFSVLLVPLSGLSLVAGVISVLILFQVSKKLAFNYAFVMSVPVLFVMGIVQICIGTSAGIAGGIIGFVISVIISFFAVKVFKYLFGKNQLNFFGIYDLGVGVIALVIGIFQLALN